MHEPENPKNKQVFPGTSSPHVHAVAVSQSLQKTEADNMVTNFRIPFQCTMPMWFQEFLNYHLIKTENNLNTHQDSLSSFLIQHKHN